ncbi:hypothetical protein [Mariniblastus fucicola]|uniref:Uncharacterized protein n=1 Tax=Mariniblastus fucicola TaxID=980251 RepID=A0A5B9P4W3_9BACT|nr:hypothetical protein [Mariniblastus fucicola]QEG20529.1 hypothetical protein MFFC18_03780 [Mariniblastus fucicola]
MAAMTTGQKEKLKEILGDSYDQQEMFRRSREEQMTKQREAAEKNALEQRAR